MFSEDINQSIYLVDVFLKVSACLLMSSLRNLFISSSILFISESNLGNELSKISRIYFCKLSPFTDVIKFWIHHGEISHFHRNSAVFIHFILSLSPKLIWKYFIIRHWFDTDLLVHLRQDHYIVWTFLLFSEMENVTSSYSIQGVPKNVLPVFNWFKQTGSILGSLFSYC